jgi:glutamate racemase
MADVADAPVGILAEGWDGLRVADQLQRLLPREDVVVLADHAYAPYARRPGAVVCDRVAHMVDVLRREYGCKLVVLASLQATLDAGAAVGAVGMTLAPAVARAATAAGGTVGVWVEPGSVRGPQLRAELRRARLRGLPVDAREDAAVGPAELAEVAAARARGALRRSGLAAVRKRPGRRTLVSTAPAAAPPHAPS